MSYTQDHTLSALYEFSLSGNVSELEALIQRHPSVLDRISLTALTETPLHRSALRGHVDFTKFLLTHKPELALELDYSKCTPLHLAAAEGHMEIVQVLLQTCEHARVQGLLQTREHPCLKKDEGGRIPLHYAAIRGRTEVAKTLIGAKPESLMVHDESGKAIWHLCVEHNHLETLKALVELVGRDHRNYSLNIGDSHDGNTIMHLAVILKQVETLRYLLSIAEMREAVNIQNKMGFSALNMLQHSPKDLRSLQIQIMLMDIAGIKNSDKNQTDHPAQSQPSTTTVTDVGQGTITDPNDHENNWSKILESMDKFIHRMGDSLEEMRGMLSVVTTMISAMTFSSAMNPPGGVVQASSDSDTILQCLHNNVSKVCPGKPVLGAPPFEDTYMEFLAFNTTSFVASLLVALLLISGLPLKNHYVTGILAIGLWFTLSFLVRAYTRVLCMLIPFHYTDECFKWGISIIFVWDGLLAFIILRFTMNFLEWLFRDLGILKSLKGLALLTTTSLLVCATAPTLGLCYILVDRFAECKYLGSLSLIIYAPIALLGIIVSLAIIRLPYWLLKWQRVLEGLKWLLYGSGVMLRARGG